MTDVHNSGKNKPQKRTVNLAVHNDEIQNVIGVRKNIAKVEKFMKMANHRIVDANSPVTQEFRQKLAIQAKELEKQIPYLDLSREKSVF